MMPVFDYPWLLALLLLPLVVRWLIPPHRETRCALAVPFLQRLARVSGQHPDAGAVLIGGMPWHGLGLAVVWCAIVLALARPQIIEPPVTREVPVRDLLLAVDLSASMSTRDFRDASGKTVDRLAAVKAVLGDFIARRKGARLGLILFGSAPFVQVPFTEDLKVCRELLDEAQVGMAGPRTAFGDAIGLAVNVFEQSAPIKERVLVVLTDGNDTASLVPPVKAAEVALDKGIVIHAVSVGDPHAVGEEALDEDTLQKVAGSTGGLYAHAADREQLQSVYRKLDQLETRKAQTIARRPRRDVYWWPLAFGLAFSLLIQAAQFLVGRITRRSLLSQQTTEGGLVEDGLKPSAGIS